ncbi:MAG: 4-hydroxy-tetrahydrodipicolinate reductase [Nitrospirae bacterium]|nr:4-hydroxy-tetrahydrodipicolinate reductase [Nitrospirota bacterium]MBI3594856.1 4-hydroxy-tetrahydrodipicolinate reductase [Nitrospirota bacterium]
MTSILVKGAGGRMGNKIISLILGDSRFLLSGAVEMKGHPAIGRDAGEMAGVGKSGVRVSEEFPPSVQSGTVCIDFSSPVSTIATCDWAERRGVPLVIGTTGFSSKQIDSLGSTSKKVALVFSPNMSIGVNVMFKLLKEAAAKMSRDYDMEVVELHHHLKKDAPSGTALKMAQILSEAMGEKLEEVAVYHRQGMTGERKKKEIGIQSVRAGDIVGEHTVYFAGLGERLEITHKATSRDNFAQGAIRAAEWVVNRPPGMYDMQAVLGF